MKIQMQTQNQFSVPAKLYRIGELVRYTPFSRQTIHNYTIMGLIQESEWTQGGHRLYDETVFARLSKILELRKTMTLVQIRKILSEENGVSVLHGTADNGGRSAGSTGFETN
jgi:DNA-binding transcriptional MerR regulator